LKVTGFTFIRNAIKLDYPIVEAIQSILPICNDFVVAVGNSEDETLDLIQSVDPNKIKIVQTKWDDNLRENGAVLAIETNKAFQSIDSESDWAFYIQGDEVIHEKYLQTIQSAMIHYKNQVEIDGLLFNYLHFYGSYDYVGASSNWYREEIRVIKNKKEIYSYKDAQGFRKGNNEKLNVAKIPAYVFHYGWVKEPKAMQQKQESFHRLWHDDKWLDQHILKSEVFEYEEHVSQLNIFKETHPKVMFERIQRKNWKFDYDISLNKRGLKDLIKDFLLIIGINASYQNYRLIERYKIKT
jgi:hypothetical protein